MNEYLIKEETLQDIANAIRNKSATTEKIKVNNMAQAINDLPDNQNSLYENIVGRVGDTDGNS